MTVAGWLVRSCAGVPPRAVAATAADVAGTCPTCASAWESCASRAASDTEEAGWTIDPALAPTRPARKGGSERYVVLMVRSPKRPESDARPRLTRAQVAALRKAGRVLTEVLDLVCAAAAPGARGVDLDGLAERAIRERGGIPAFRGYRGYPATLCVSPERVVIHGIPTPLALRAGEIVSFDLGVVVRGMHADAARTLMIPGGRTGLGARRSLIAAVEDALAAGLARLRPGASSDELARAIGAAIAAQGAHAVPEVGGHGIGLQLHEDPILPNVPGIVPPTRFEPGHAYAIEPIAVDAAGPLDLDPGDGWTLRALPGRIAAHIEHTVYLRPDGHLEVIAR